MKNQIQDLIAQAQQERAAYEETAVKCGIIGLSGAGKSSLINAIVGVEVCKAGSTEQTMKAQSVHHNGIEFVDLPGCGTEKWPRDTYIADLKLETYDCLMIVTSNRLYESDVELYTEMALKRSVPCFIVRTKIDLAVADEAHDNGLSEEDALDKIRADFETGSSINLEQVYLVSARKPKQWDLIKLVEAIVASQEGLKQDRFIAAVAPLSKGVIREKRRVAEKVLSWYSAGSFANGFNPFLGADLALDATLVMRMVKEFHDIYGITDEQMEYTEKCSPKLRGNPHYQALKISVLQSLVRYSSTAGVKYALTKTGAGIAAKNASKIVPLAGHVLSAFIGGGLTYNFGRDYLSNIEAKAEQMLNEVLINS